MRLHALRLLNFRNHEDTALDLGAGINALIGRNGQGKTNILEAVSYFSLGKSFFAAADAQVVQYGHEFFEITATLNDDAERPSQAHIAFSASSGQKAVRINGTPLDRISAIVGEYPAVLLSPDHGGIIGSGPAERRKFLDIVLCQTSSRYLADLQEYRKVLRQRNRLLLDGRLHGSVSASALEPWTQGLVQYGSRIIEKRLQCVEAMRDGFASSYAEIAGFTEPVALEYVTVRGVKSGHDIPAIASVMEEHLGTHRQLELRRGTTLVGPHRDDLAFMLRSRNAQEFASQGEHKTLLIALKLAEHRYMCETRNETPILLLDDVFAELDSERASRVLGRLGETGQAVLTTTDPGVVASVPWNRHHRRFLIEGGTSTAQNP
ncbi:MAG TPA: DNA replication/repair protein RecF [Bacteroidota bacterium]|nr:DNA replication/repair protein RecF [Bacteroidota bacterium]